jgi:hypothetical protein
MVVSPPVTQGDWRFVDMSLQCSPDQGDGGELMVATH